MSVSRLIDMLLIRTDIRATRRQMGSTTLAERFARTKGEPQDVNGMLVHNIYRRSIADGTLVHVRRSYAVHTPRQGIRIKVDRGMVVVNGQSLKDVVLWADSSPADVALVCETGRRPAGELRVWNCWMEKGNIMQAWIGDAGMVIEDGRLDRVSIKCSDGTHSFAPSDLMFELLFENASSHRPGRRRR